MVLLLAWRSRRRYGSADGLDMPNRMSPGRGGPYRGVVEGAGDVLVGFSKVEQRDRVPPEAVVAAPDHVGGAACEDQGGVANLEDPSGVSEVAALGFPQLGGDLGDLPAAARLRQSVCDEHGGWMEELGQGLGVVDHEGVLQQGLQLLRHRSAARCLQADTT